MLSKITNISTLLTQNTTFIVTARKFLRLLQKKEPCPCLNLKMNYFRGHIIPMLTSCPDLVGRLVFKVSSTCCSWSPASSTTSTQSSTRSSTPFSPGSTNTSVETFHVHHSDSLRRFRRGFSDIYTKCWNSQVQPWPF